MLSRCSGRSLVALIGARHDAALRSRRPFFSCSACATARTHRSERSVRPGHHDGKTRSRASDTTRAPTPQPQPQPPPPPPTDADCESLGVFQRFKTMAKRYWYVVLPVHVITSAAWFGSFYFLASSGVDVPVLLESVGFPDWIVDRVKDGNSWTSYLVIAYGLYKIFTPLRYMVTLGGTGATIRCLRKWGYKIDGAKTK